MFWTMQVAGTVSFLNHSCNQNQDYKSQDQDTKKLSQDCLEARHYLETFFSIFVCEI